MARVRSNTTTYLPPSTTRVLHAGPCRVHGVLASGLSTGAGTFTLYDNTAASGAVLFSASVSLYAPLLLLLSPLEALDCTSGLTAVTDANCRLFVIGEW